MLIPIGDDDRNLPGPALVTIGLILLNVIVFFLFQAGGTNFDFTYGWSVIPFEITNGVDLTNAVQLTVDGQSVQIPQSVGPTPIYLTVFSAMFMHGGYAHLLGNLLFLWIFGDNVEHRFGKGLFLGFYFASGIAATLAQIVLAPDSVIPNLGASGAISGVLGAYMVLFPRNRVHALFFFYIISVPAMLAIGVWIAFQLISGWGTLSAGSSLAGGVAYGAHIGGFIAGALIAFIHRSIVSVETPHKYSAVSATERSGRRW